MKWICSFLLLFAAGLTLSAARLPGTVSPRFVRLNSEQGLPNNDVRVIAQDKQGFIWLGTSLGGLNRYDGYEFKNYINDPANPRSISHNYIWSILIDSRGVLWVGSHGGGLNRYHAESDSFEHFMHDPKNPKSIPNNAVLSLYEDSKGRLWVGTRGGLSRYIPESGNFVNTSLETAAFPAANLNSVRSITEDPLTGLLWLGTSDGLCAFDPSTGGRRYFLRRPDASRSDGMNSINGVIIDREGVFWLVAEEGLYRFKPGLTRIPADASDQLVYPDLQCYVHDPKNPRSLSSNHLRTGIIDGDGYLWLGSLAGLNRFDRLTGSVERFLHSAGDPNSIGSSLIQRLFIDRDGSLWVATNNGGVCRSISQDKPFEVLRHSFDNANSVSNDIVTGLDFDQKGRLWAGTMDGLNCYDGERWTVYRHDPYDPESLPANHVSDLCVDDEGSLWIGTPQAGLARFKDGRFKRFQRKPDDPPQEQSPLPYTGSQINSLYKDRMGRIWIGARSHGLDLRRQDDFLHFPAYIAGGGRRPTDNAMPGFLDEMGGLWYGTELRGLLRLDPSTGATKAFFINPENPESFTNTNIYCLLPDERGNLWVGGITGLHRFDLARQSFVRRYNTKDGLPGDAVVSMLADDQGYLWLGTSSGLGRFDPSTGTCTVFDRSDGLPSELFIINSAIKDGRGRLYFGTSGGAVAFDPRLFKTNIQAPEIVFTGFELSDRSVLNYGNEAPLEVPIHMAKRITLRHDQSVFAIRFAALDFNAPEKNHYSFKMEGFDPAWRFTDARRRIATYTNLSPGRYVFKVQGSNNDGVWSVRPAAIEILILPPWWGSPWFRIAFAMTSLATVISGYRWRVRRIRARTRMLEEQVADRTRELKEAKEHAEAASTAKSSFLASMSHELRTPLNGILGYAQILGRDKDLTEKQLNGINTIAKSGEHLLTLINDILDLSRIEAGKFELQQSEIHLPSFLRVISDIVRIKAEIKGLRFECQTPQNLPSCIHADEKRLRQVLLNLLGNAVKFTDRGSVTLRLRFLPEDKGEDSHSCRIYFEVEDTGIGISSDQQGHLFAPFEQMADARHREGGAGLGLAISRQIVRLMGGDIQVRSQLGQGSVFWFHLHCQVIEESKAGATDMPAIIGYAGRRRRILVVDDVEDNRTLLVDALQSYGFETQAASSGPECLELLPDRAPDLIVMDIMMPVMDGIQVIGAIKRMGHEPRIPIIAISADVTTAGQIRSIAAGADYFLSKPVDLDALRDQVGVLLGLSWVRQPVSSLRHRAADIPDEFLRPPPREDLEALHTLALRGNMSDIRVLAQAIAARGDESAAFAGKVLRLSEEFQSRAILTLIKSFNSKEPGP